MPYDLVLLVSDNDSDVLHARPEQGFDLMIENGPSGVIAADEAFRTFTVDGTDSRSLTGGENNCPHGFLPITTVL
jgi:hypothetical protein